MRKSIFFLAFAPLLLSLAAQAAPFKKNPAQLDAKIVEAQARLASIQAKPKRSIPAAIMKSAQGIIILRQLKVGLGFGADAGGGVALVKGPDGLWSAPAFVGTANASWGAQIGAQDKDIIMLLMNDEGLKLLREGKRGNVGIEYQAAIGPADIGVDIDTNLLSPILVYSDAAGGFAGVALKGGGIVGAKSKNMTYYGMTLQEILFSRNAEKSESAQNLIAYIESLGTL